MAGCHGNISCFFFQFFSCLWFYVPPKNHLNFISQNVVFKHLRKDILRRIYSNELKFSDIVFLSELCVLLKHKTFLYLAYTISY